MEPESLSIIVLRRFRVVEEEAGDLFVMARKALRVSKTRFEVNTKRTCPS